MSERVKRGERMVRLTERFVQNVPIPPRVPGVSQIEYTDLEIRGLKLSVGYGGTKAFYLRWGRGRGRRAVRLGAYPMLTVGKARQRAIELKAQLQDGHVPRANWLFDRSVPTFIEFVEGRYLPYARLAKKSSQLEEQRLRARVLPRFGHLQLNQIHPQDIQAFMNEVKEVNCAATANRYYAMIRRILELAVRWEVYDVNPAAKISKFRENSARQRYLTGEELRRFLDALDALRHSRLGVHATLFRFLLITGVRYGEAVAAEWKNVDLDSPEPRWLLPDTKSGSSRWVVLNPGAVEILRSLRTPLGPNPEGAVFRYHGGARITTSQHAFRRVLQAAGIKDFRIHDLRHTFASHAVNSGATLYEVQHLLGHKSSLTTTRYAHLNDDRLRAISTTVAGTLGGKATSQTKPPITGE